MFDLFGKLFGNNKQNQGKIDIKDVSQSTINVLQVDKLDLSSFINSPYQNVIIGIYEYHLDDFVSASSQNRIAVVADLPRFAVICTFIVSPPVQLVGRFAARELFFGHGFPSILFLIPVPGRFR